MDKDEKKAFETLIRQNEQIIQLLKQVAAQNRQ